MTIPLNNSKVACFLHFKHYLGKPDTQPARWLEKGVESLRGTVKLQKQSFGTLTVLLDGGGKNPAC